MRNHDLWSEDPACLFRDRHCASIDPISAAVGGIIPALFSGLSGGGKPEAPAPAAPPPPAAPPKAPAPKQNPTQQSTFIGSVPTPPPATGGKTLLGT